jgi:myosin-crossreactive antigen
MTELAKTSGGNDYAGLQRKLTAFATALDAAAEALTGIHQRMTTNASLAQETAQQLGEAHGDAKYVELTSNVSVLLGGAAVQARRTQAAAEEAASASREAAAAHKKKYGGLDGIRRSRTTKTPKPGFFD